MHMSDQSTVKGGQLTRPMVDSPEPMRNAKIPGIIKVLRPTMSLSERTRNRRKRVMCQLKIAF